jgi:hypothetical protein
VRSSGCRRVLGGGGRSTAGGGAASTAGGRSEGRSCRGDEKERQRREVGGRREAGGGRRSRSRARVVLSFYGCMYIFLYSNIFGMIHELRHE